MPATAAMDFLVKRQNLRQCGFASFAAEAAPGEVLLQIEKFAFTANNVTYAAFGEAMKYWHFFPAKDESQWGRIPVGALPRSWNRGTRISTTASASTATCRCRRTSAS